MSNSKFCPNCGEPNGKDGRFCGGCGSNLSARAETPVPPTPQQAPAVTPVPAATVPNKKPAILGWIMGGIGVAMLVSVAFVNGMLGEPSSPGSDGSGGNGEESREGQDPTEMDDDVVADRFDPESTEVDRAGDFAYIQNRESCNEHSHFTDIVKDIGREIDSEMRDLTAISADEEERYGDECIEELTDQTGGTLVSSGPMVDYITSLAQPLLEHVDRDDIEYQFYVLEDLEMVNALALPGGHIVFTKPLLDTWIDNEAQLVTVLGHEIAHVDLRHPVAMLQYLKALGLSDDDIVASMAINLAQMPYSSTLEAASDAQGAKYAHAVGYSVFQSVDLWQARANEQSGGSSGPNNQDNSNDPLGGLLGGVLGTVLGELDNLLITHPDPARRACLLKQVAFELYYQDPIPMAYVGTTNWRRRTPMSDQTY